MSFPAACSIRSGAVAVALILCAACAKGGEEATAEVAAVVNAETAVASVGAFTESIGAIGTVVPRAGHLAVLSAPTATRVASVLVSPGQHVDKGDALVELDQTAIAAEAQSADAALMAAQQGFDRAQRMVNQGIAPRRDLESASAELARAKAEVAAARRTADLATMRSPIRGVVTRMSAAIGASVDASQPLVEVADPDEVDIVLTLPPGEAARVHAGARVQLHGGAGADGDLLGEASVAEISGIVDSLSHGVAIRARSGKLTRPLRLGETVFGQVVLAIRPKAITIPALALVPEGDGFKVFVVDSAGVAHSREVTIGGRSAGSVEITKGLEAGERVVTAGAYGVTDSAKIVRPGEKPGATDSTKDGE